MFFSIFVFLNLSVILKMSLVFRKLKYCLIRQYNNINVYEFLQNHKKEYEEFNDYIVDMSKCNYKYQKDKDFNFISKNRFIIENKDEDYYVMYIVYRLFEKKIIYGVTDVAIEFNPQKDILLYYNKLNIKHRFYPKLIEFYFESREKNFYQDYDPMYIAVFQELANKPNLFYQEFETELYEPSYFEWPKMPNNFKLTKQLTNTETRTPIAIRNYNYNANIERLLDNTYYNKRRRDQYLNEYNTTTVTNYYDINNPESMFFDLREDSTSDLSYMYINSTKFEFDSNADHVQVPKGDYCLYYNKRNQSIGIRYVFPVWFDKNKKPNPLLRSYIYIKRLSNKDKNEQMKEQTIDFYTKDNFHLYRLKYTNKNIEEMDNISVSFEDFKKKFEDYKRNYYLRRRLITSWSDRNNPYIDDSIRNEY